MGEGKMALNKSVETYSEDAGLSGPVSGEALASRAWLFKHEALIQALDGAQIIDQKTLVNTLNHTHFTDRAILVHLRHKKYEESILLRVYPELCLGGELTCRWSNEHPAGLDLENFQCLHLIIADGKSMILVPAHLKEISRESVTTQLPETSYAVGQRQARRYACHEVAAELSQSGFCARGELLDFSPAGFRVSVRPEASCSFHWFNSDESVTIHLRHGEQILFSGPCSCIREHGDLQNRDIVLAPLDKMIRRFKKKLLSNPRKQLVPSPTVSFEHPFLKRRIQMEVHDISTSGFSVCEKHDEGVLIPGMIIPRLTISFAEGPTMGCTAQVIYRLEEEEGIIRCGFAILDMDIKTYSRLAHIITKALDPQAHICGAVDMDALWEFFFDSGFVYPAKYRLIQSHREEFKETYRKLYQEAPEIARHFTYQKNGRIYGHISMVRAYQRTWMIHHYAAGVVESRRLGFPVLKQMMHYLNDMCRMPSAKIDYVMCYFRSENRIPKLIFGGFARSLKNPRACSLDPFGYLPYTSLSLGTDLPSGWSLKPCTPTQLWDLSRFYGHHSGGILLDALDLERGDNGNEPLEKVYARLGFVRKWQAYALTHMGELNAVLIVNQSDLGLNLSELLNSIKIMVTKTEGLPWNVLSTAIAQLTAVYDMERVPVLFYPFDYVQANRLPFEKRYHCWTLDVSYGQEYLDFVQRKFRITYK